MVDLLAVTGLDQLLLILKLYFYTKQPILMWRSTALSVNWLEGVGILSTALAQSNLKGVG
jgi:hypothetical protein